MYDTIGLQLTHGDYPSGDFVADLSRCLTSVSTFERGGFRHIVGDCGRLKVRANNWSVSVGGCSLPKWVAGNNYKPLSRAETRQAVEMMSDRLHLPMKLARVTRLDAGATITTSQPPSRYIGVLGELSRAKRQTVSGDETETLYYIQQYRRLCFYDKNKEQRNNGEPIPMEYADKHVLRYEYRLLRRLPAQMGEREVTAAMLYDERFYHKVLNKWKQAYFSIRKEGDITINIDDMNSVKALHNVGILSLVERFGGEAELLAQVKDKFRRGVISRKQAHDMRAAIRRACSTGGDLITPNELANELDSGIMAAFERFQ